MTEKEAFDAWFNPDDAKNYRDCWSAACRYQRSQDAADCAQRQAQPLTNPQALQQALQQAHEAWRMTLPRQSALRSESEAFAAGFKAQRQADPVRQHVEAFAAKSGWTPDDGEGAFEFVQRVSYEQGAKDAQRQAGQEAVAIVAVTPNGGATVGWMAGHIAQHNELLYTAPPAAQVPLTDARKYRLLASGEAICEGDEFIDDDTVTWHPVRKGFCGHPWGGAWQPMRRAETPDTPR